jgi:hypothetical protein
VEVKLNRTRDEGQNALALGPNMKEVCRHLRHDPYVLVNALEEVRLGLPS